MSNGVNNRDYRNLESDPEIKYTKGWRSEYANLSIATSESWKGKNSGDLQEKVEWHRGCNVF